jgi:hypothetical protein
MVKQGGSMSRHETVSKAGSIFFGSSLMLVASPYTVRSQFSQRGELE